jgi:hypothetical protein
VFIILDNASNMLAIFKCRVLEALELEPEALKDAKETRKFQLQMSWVELVDPSNNDCFFANLVTGECEWVLPEGAQLRQKDPDQEEWWELFDENHKLHYYYNTKTMETVWDPPDRNIIPLAKLQKALKDREDNGTKRQSTLVFSPNLENLTLTFQEKKDTNQLVAQESRLVLEDTSPRNLYLNRNSNTEVANNAWVELVDPSNNDCFFANLITGECSWVLPEGAQLRQKDPDQEEWWELFDENHKLNYYYNTKTMETVWDPPERNIIPLAKLQKAIKDIEDNGSKRQSTLVFSPNFEKLTLTFQEKKDTNQLVAQESRLVLEDSNISLNGISNPQNDPEAAKKMKDQMMQNHEKELTRLPDDLVTDIKNFSMIGFAEQYFAKQKSGFIFKKEIQIHELLKYQNKNLKKPLMTQSENYKREGLKCFKNILVVYKISLNTL